MVRKFLWSVPALAGLLQPALAAEAAGRAGLEALIATHAAANDVPAALVHRVIQRESRYNPRAVGRGGTFGLMQIKHGTARALGYTGAANGLLDADTNLKFAVRYLAGAYRVANGDHNRAVAYFARGYYYDAKRKGLLGKVAQRTAQPEPEPEVVETATVEAEQTGSIPSPFTPAANPYLTRDAN
jgi:soluble lytic murein transglycosylase-like protein